MKKINPITLVKEEFNYSPEEIAMNNEDFFISFAMDDHNDQPYIDETIYIIEAISRKWENGVLIK